MAAEVESREWVMAAYAEQGLLTAEHLVLRTSKLSLDATSVPDGHVLLQVLGIPVDPYLRSQMAGTHDGLHLPPFQLGQVITAFGAGRIIRSKDARFSEGDLVTTSPSCPVSEYCVTPTFALRKVDPRSGVPLLEYLNALGLPGFTAWAGLQFIGAPKPGENVFISAAAGAVGMFAGQLAKIKGCRVVGSTGTDDKVNLLKKELKFDDAFNYKKETDLDAALSKYFPTGIDVYFDNVGGKMLEAVLNHVNSHARIPLCGMISQYNQVWTERAGVRNLLNMVGKNVKMQGFMVGSYLDQFDRFVKETEGYLREGKLISKSTVNNGIENFLESLNSLFSSSNVGKVIIKVSE